MLNMASLVSRVTVGPAGSMRAGAFAWGPWSLGTGELWPGSSVGLRLGTWLELEGCCWVGVWFCWARQVVADTDPASRQRRANRRENDGIYIGWTKGLPFSLCAGLEGGQRVSCPMRSAALQCSNRSRSQSHENQVDPRHRLYRCIFRGRRGRAAHRRPGCRHRRCKPAGSDAKERRVGAAVAVGCTLAAVYPFAGNLGGGGFMLIHEHGGKNVFIDYREKASLAATTNMYLDTQGNIIPNASIVGYRAIGVPGSVA